MLPVGHHCLRALTAELVARAWTGTREVKKKATPAMENRTAVAAMLRPSSPYSATVEMILVVHAKHSQAPLWALVTAVPTIAIVPLRSSICVRTLRVVNNILEVSSCGNESAVQNKRLYAGLC